MVDWEALERTVSGEALVTAEEERRLGTIIWPFFALLLNVNTRGSGNRD
jgi:hypothetical protein